MEREDLIDLIRELLESKGIGAGSVATPTCPCVNCRAMRFLELVNA